jgi:4-amino-4-deoxy-L-arabinose transferase-like glycosyltransferase
VIDLAARNPSLARVRARASDVPWFWLGVGSVAAALAGVLGAFLNTWPVHEDEALALFTGRAPLPDLLWTVIADRGGAPLHFVLAWGVVHLGGGLTALRALSLVFAVASIPAIAALGSRLADRLTGFVAAALASATWVLLFHGIYGRMYSLFLFTSALSFIALLDALELGGRRRFVLWGIASWLMLASHPYAALVLAAQVAFIALGRVRLRPAALALGALVVAATPFWWADVVLRNRFDVGVGGGGPQLGSPRSVLHYFWWVSGDMSAGHHKWSTPVLLLALAGLVLLVLRRPASALLIACVVVVPGMAFVVARLHSTASPEARHLIFVLPFFATLLAVPLVALGRARPPLTAIAAAAAVAVLIVGEARWAERKTPPLFDGDPRGEAPARDRAAAWLVAGARRDDVLLGYEPVYLRAWERDRSFSRHALPRADPELLAKALKDVPEPLGRGVWVFDASDTTNVWERQTIRFALPEPAAAFEGRAYGPYLVIRSREPLRTRQRFLDVSEEVMRLGRKLQIGDADVNLHSLLVAESRFF